MNIQTGKSLQKTSQTIRELIERDEWIKIFYETDGFKKAVQDVKDAVASDLSGIINIVVGTETTTTMRNITQAFIKFVFNSGSVYTFANGTKFENNLADPKYTRATPGSVRQSHEKEAHTCNLLQNEIYGRILAYEPYEIKEKINNDSLPRDERNKIKAKFNRLIPNLASEQLGTPGKMFRDKLAELFLAFYDDPSIAEQKLSYLISAESPDTRIDRFVDYMEELEIDLEKMKLKIKYLTDKKNEYYNSGKYTNTQEAINIFKQMESEEGEFYAKNEALDQIYTMITRLFPKFPPSRPAYDKKSGFLGWNGEAALYNLLSQLLQPFLSLENFKDYLEKTKSKISQEMQRLNNPNDLFTKKNYPTPADILKRKKFLEGELQQCEGILGCMDKLNNPTKLALFNKAFCKKIRDNIDSNKSLTVKKILSRMVMTNENDIKPIANQLNKFYDSILTKIEKNKDLPNAYQLIINTLNTSHINEYYYETDNRGTKEKKTIAKRHSDYMQDLQRTFIQRTPRVLILSGADLNEGICQEKPQASQIASGTGEDTATSRVTTTRQNAPIFAKRSFAKILEEFHSIISTDDPVQKKLIGGSMKRSIVMISHRKIDFSDYATAGSCFGGVTYIDLDQILRVDEQQAGKLVEKYVNDYFRGQNILIKDSDLEEMKKHLVGRNIPSAMGLILSALIATKPKIEVDKNKPHRLWLDAQKIAGKIKELSATKEEGTDCLEKKVVTRSKDEYVKPLPTNEARESQRAYIEKYFDAASYWGAMSKTITKLRDEIQIIKLDIDDLNNGIKQSIVLKNKYEKELQKNPNYATKLQALINKANADINSPQTKEELNRLTTILATKEKSLQLLQDRYNKNLKEGMPVSLQILTGPPATSKSYFPEVIAHELGFNFYIAKLGEVAGPLMGTTEQRTKNVFEAIKQMKNTIVIFDEIGLTPGFTSGAIASQNAADVAIGSVKAQVLAFFNDNEALFEKNHVYIFGATNHINNVDAAITSRSHIQNIDSAIEPDNMPAVFKCELNYISTGTAQYKRFFDKIMEFGDAFLIEAGKKLIESKGNTSMEFRNIHRILKDIWSKFKTYDTYEESYQVFLNDKSEDKIDWMEKFPEHHEQWSVAKAAGKNPNIPFHGVRDFGINVTKENFLKMMDGSVITQPHMDDPNKVAYIYKPGLRNFPSTTTWENSEHVGNKEPKQLQLFENIPQQTPYPKQLQQEKPEVVGLIDEDEIPEDKELVDSDKEVELQNQENITNQPSPPPPNIGMNVKSSTDYYYNVLKKQKIIY